MCVKFIFNQLGCSKDCIISVSEENLKELVQAYEMLSRLRLVTNSFGMNEEEQKRKNNIFAVKSMDHWNREVHHNIGRIPH